MPSCAQLDKAFRNSEQKIASDIIKLKNKLNYNAYWGRVKEGGSFPKNSGTRIKKIRLSRVGFGQGDVGWRQVDDSGCLTNVCSHPLSETVTHGSLENFYSLETFRVTTQPICLAMLVFRERPEEELMHLESSLHEIARYFWDDWLRTRYINMAANKQVATVSRNFLSTIDPCKVLEIQCNPEITSDAFLFWNRDPDNMPVLNSAYIMDERYVSVNVNPADIDLIGELSGDWMETACMALQYDPDNMPFMDEGVPLLDLVTSDVRVARRMIQLERRQESECLPAVMYQGEKLSLSLGVTHVVRDYIGMRWDRFALKFYPDVVYNSTLASYNSTDPATWPRFQRVFPFYPYKLPNGTLDYRPNPYYSKAPFGISTIFTPKVMTMQTHPVAESVGGARLGDPHRSYSGDVRWRNEYDKVCNPDYETGNWEMNFGAAAEPNRPENGHAFFHRIDTSVRIAGVKCPPNMMGCSQTQMTTDCYNVALSGETVTPGVSRGANTVSLDNSLRFFI